MIFQHTWRKVLSGEKTQTRRLVNGETLTPRGVLVGDRIKWQIEQTYAVCPSRTKKSVGRIKLFSIRAEDVRYISDEDVSAEGYDSRHDFLLAWIKMHDKRAYKKYSNEVELHRRTQEITDAWLTGLINRIVSARPQNKYDAWALQFELVESYDGQNPDGVSGEDR